MNIDSCYFKSYGIEDYNYYIIGSQFQHYENKNQLLTALSNGITLLSNNCVIRSIQLANNSDYKLKVRIYRNNGNYDYLDRYIVCNSNQFLQLFNGYSVLANGNSIKIAITKADDSQLENNLNFSMNISYVQLNTTVGS